MNLKDKPGPFRVGQTAPGIKQFQELIDAVPPQFTGPDSMQIERAGEKMSFGNQEKDLKAEQVFSPIRQFIMASEEEDYLICKPFCHNAGNDPDHPPEDPMIYDYALADLPPWDDPEIVIYVAKPLILQKSFWHQQTVTLAGISVTYTYTGLGERTATGVVGGVSITEKQFITPSYFPGEILSGREGITQLKRPGPDLIPRGVIMWTDINEGGRAWAADCPGT